MTIWRMSAAAAEMGETWHEAPLPLLFVGILSAAMAGALGLLLGWHIYLAASCQVHLQNSKLTCRRLRHSSAFCTSSTSEWFARLQYDVMQSTIDFHGNWARAAEAKRSRQRWQRPPHPTACQNLQVLEVMVALLSASSQVHVDEQWLCTVKDESSLVAMCLHSLWPSKCFTMCSAGGWCAQIVQEIFDVRGRWWYIMWLLPRWPRRHQHKALQTESLNLG
jgi:hypothetical protein